jgi:hypothetical protein
LSDMDENYLIDLGMLLKSHALEARSEARAAVNTPDYDFKSGRAFAYYEVISLMIQQADAFQLPREAMRLDDIDPERDLLPP